MRKMVMALTVSAMLAGMIAVVTAPAFAVTAHGMPELKNKLDTSILPQKGAEYVLTISGKAQQTSPAGGFTRYDLNTISRHIDLRNFVASHGWMPVSGQIKIRAADLSVAAETPSQHRESLSLLTNPNSVAFTVESGSVQIGSKTYTVNSGVVVYYKKFFVTANGEGFELNADGTLSGGIPDMQSISNMTNMHTGLRTATAEWAFDGGISMSKS